MKLFETPLMKGQARNFLETELISKDSTFDDY